MRLLSMALAWVLLLSAGALAQEAEVSAAARVELGVGVYSGQQRSVSDETSGAAGYQISGLVSLKNYPVALSGSYASFAPKSFTDASGTEFSLAHTVQVVDLLAGYQVLPYLAVGAGWASYGYSDELGDDRWAGGVAVGAFADYPVHERVRVGGKVYVVPAVRIEHLPADTGTLWGLWLRAAYALRPNLSLEAGYRTLKVDLETGDSFDTGGLFAGVVYTF